MPGAYCFIEYGGPETQQLLERPMPTPGPGQLLVAVRAAGVNPADWKVRSGARRATVPVTFPAVLGREVSGVVTGVGEGVSGFSVGDAVFGATATGFGGYAEYTLTDASSTALKPSAVSFADAAVIPVAIGTAYDALTQLDLRAGSTLLVVGAGGGTGQSMLQLAALRGVSVTGVAGSAKRELVESLGATWVESGQHLLSRIPGTVDAVFDAVGADLSALVTLVTDPKQLISIGNTTGAQELGGSGVTRRRTSEVFTEIAALVAASKVDPHVTARLPLSRAGEALALVESGHSTGKVVIEVS
ncbi:MAG: NADP-dependent oxidoreductase [Rhodococcus sp.]|nr:NADP-dependent oxidoreductase [Rhodococcus sp. (in: high G+C Gram-positive bacteria)]